ncbi:MAG: hypothetical protein GVY15_11985 [Bacteroidetes bacterium]|jgi:hypothetical protein|nr:hypothetical protein [Bacteroidota bacterium]
MILRPINAAARPGRDNHFGSLTAPRKPWRGPLGCSWRFHVRYLQRTYAAAATNADWDHEVLAFSETFPQ